MRIAILGAGNVGIGVANALVMLGIGGHITLYNRSLDRALANVWDLEDAIVLLGTMSLRATNVLEDIANHDIVVVTIGAKQKPNQTRIELLEENAILVENLMKELDTIVPNAIVIMVTNPVDVLTRIAIKNTKRAPNKIFGSGTVLDTMRLREQIGLMLNINRKNIHAYIVGEHGDSEFALWSVSTIGPILLDEFGIEDLERKKEQILAHVRKRAYDIIEKKGFTSQAIGVAVARVIESILHDDKRIFTLSSSLEHNCASINSDIAISQPCVVGKEGIERKLMLKCDLKEANLLKASAQKLDTIYQNLRS